MVLIVHLLTVAVHESLLVLRLDVVVNQCLVHVVEALAAAVAPDYVNEVFLQIREVVLPSEADEHNERDCSEAEKGLLQVVCSRKTQIFPNQNLWVDCAVNSKIPLLLELALDEVSLEAAAMLGSNPLQEVDVVRRSGSTHTFH